MSQISRVLLALASALLLFALPLPLWRIRLIAPQYPEGLGMDIHARSVRGAKEHDLDNINNLNHYIGMKTIEPETIAELRVIPWLIVGLGVFGLVVAAVRKRAPLIAWLVEFGVLGVVGLWDFWHWEYDYGHNLDFKHAIIKVPGMTYQPPLIGSKQLLNFTASSWPSAGAILLGVAFLLGIAALVVRERAATPRGAVA
jgi:copper chaperone NosL